MERNLTIQDLINMGYNIEALEEYYQGIFTKEELVQILNNELEPIYLEGELIPQDYPKKIIHK